MIRLVSVDIDGTLLNDRRQIGKETLEIVPQLKDTLFVLNSGRPYAGIVPYIQQLGIYDSAHYCITNTGAVIYDNMGEKSVSERLLGARDFTLLEQMKPAELSVVCYNAHALCSNDVPVNAEIRKELDILNVPLEPYHVSSGKPIERLNLIGPKEKIQEFLHRHNATLQENYYTIINEPTVFEVLHPESGKGKALKRLADILGLKKEEIMAIGDNANDVEMLETAGVSVAMGNGTPEVKAVSDFVTKTNNEDGVAYALKKFVL